MPSNDNPKNTSSKKKKKDNNRKNSVTGNIRNSNTNSNINSKRSSISKKSTKKNRTIETRVFYAIDEERYGPLLASVDDLETELNRLLEELKSSADEIQKIKNAKNDKEKKAIINKKISRIEKDINVINEELKRNMKVIEEGIANGGIGEETQVESFENSNSGGKTEGSNYYSAEENHFENAKNVINGNSNKIKSNQNSNKLSSHGDKDNTFKTKIFFGFGSGFILASAIIIPLVLNQ